MVDSFFQGFNFDTLIATISCIAGVAALFVGTKAYQQCKIIKNSFNDEKEYENSNDNSQKAGRDIINYNCDTEAITNITNANFAASLNNALEKLEQNSKKNLQEIIEKSKNILAENKVVLASYDKIDWINIYLESAKNTSNVYMQEIWAKVLARELSKPNSFSYKSLDILKNMTEKDFKLFEELCSFQTDGFIPSSEVSDDYISWSKKIKLEELGLINLSKTTRWYLITAQKTTYTILGKECLMRTENKMDTDEKIELSVYLLTTAAMEIINVGNYFYNPSLFVKAMKQTKEKYKQKMEISLYKINTITEEHTNCDAKDLLMDN